MSEIWCRSECQPDDETPEIQHITIHAYGSADDAEMHLGGSALKSFCEDREGLRLGRMTLLRYAAQEFNFNDIDSGDLSAVSQTDEEGREIMQALMRAEAISGGRKSYGLIMGKSMHVVPSARGQGIMKRLLQEARRLHAGMPFHYAHRAIPQEGSCYAAGYEAKMERLQNGYLKAGVGLTVPDAEAWPEIMIGYWEGRDTSVDECILDWHKVRNNLMTATAIAA